MKLFQAFFGEIRQKQISFFNECGCGVWRIPIEQIQLTKRKHFISKFQFHFEKFQNLLNTRHPAAKGMFVSKIELELSRSSEINNSKSHQQVYRVCVPSIWCGYFVRNLHLIDIFYNWFFAKAKIGWNYYFWRKSKLIVFDKKLFLWY